MHRFFVRISLVLGFFLVAHAAHAQVNPGCTFIGNHFSCPLVEGSALYQIQFVRSPQQLSHIRLHNQTGKHIQIDLVAGWSTEYAFNEFCVNLDEFVPVASQPQTGAVGCIHKDNGENFFPTLTWDPHNQGRGVAVDPGSTIFISTNIDALVASGVPSATLTFFTSTKKQVSGVMSFNQPSIDRVIPCNGVPDSTHWTPYKNTGSRPWKTDGATIYTVEPGGLVNAACIYVLNTSGQVRWSHCTGANQRGHVTFPLQIVQPGESLAAQANHVCPSGAWDWAAYLHVYF